jgi:hypothetical protein
MLEFCNSKYLYSAKIQFLNILKKNNILIKNNLLWAAVGVLRYES